MVEYNVAIITTSMPGMMMFVKWARGDITKKRVLGKPSAEENEHPTIGRNRWRRSRDGRVDADSNDSTCNGSEDDIMDGQGKMAKSLEVLVETHAVEGMR